jgi:hypothetical protein
MGVVGEGRGVFVRRMFGNLAVVPGGRKGRAA